MRDYLNKYEPHTSNLYQAYNKVNIEEYISSGVIQAIVLGLASKEEEREFEKLAATYPELKQAALSV